MKGYTKGKHITQEIFDKVKKMLSIGLTIGQVKEITGYAYNTVHHIKQMKDFEAFQAFKEQYRAKVMAKLHPMGVVPTTATGEQLKKSEQIKTPMYDVLVEIRNEIQTLNKNFATFGKAKSFRLF